MTNDRFNQPSQGQSDWHLPLNENFDDLGIEVTNEVETFDDLPAPDSDETSSNDNPRRYLVRQSRIVYRDNGSEWEAVGGLGSEYIVGEGDDLMAEIEEHGKGHYILQPREDDYLIDRTNDSGHYGVPTGVHIRGDGSIQPEGGQNDGAPGIYDPPNKAPVLSPLNPSQNGLYLEAFSSAGNCWVKTSNEAGTVNAGGPRYTGRHWNMRSDGEDYLHAWWGGRQFATANGGDPDDDNPTMTLHNRGGQGDALWCYGEGPSIARFRGPGPSNSTRGIDLEADTNDGGFAHIAWIDYKGQLYLGASEPSLLFNAPSTYAGNYPSEEELSVMEAESNDAISINAGFAKKANDLGSKAGEVKIHVSNDNPFRVTDPVHGRALFQLDSQDLTASSAPSPSEEGVYATHDGTGSAAGLYRSDPENNRWVKVENNSVRISY